MRALSAVLLVFGILVFLALVGFLVWSFVRDQDFTSERKKRKKGVRKLGFDLAQEDFYSPEGEPDTERIRRLSNKYSAKDHDLLIDSYKHRFEELSDGDQRARATVDYLETLRTSNRSKVNALEGLRRKR